MRIAIGADHAGFELKAHLVALLRRLGHDVDDLGTHSDQRCDYPPICAAVARAASAGTAVGTNSGAGDGADFGIVLGGSGQGEQIAANKVHGARAALCNDLYTARMARAHNDANVLAIGARIVAPALADEIVAVFLTTTFEGDRHVARLAQIREIEREECAQ